MKNKNKLQRIKNIEQKLPRIDTYIKLKLEKKRSEKNKCQW